MRRRHLDMVTAVVFYAKVPVAARGQNPQGQIALEPIVLVPHFVSQIDTETAHGSGCKHHGQPRMPWQFMLRNKLG